MRLEKIGSAMKPLKKGYSDFRSSEAYLKNMESIEREKIGSSHSETESSSLVEPVLKMEPVSPTEPAPEKKPVLKMEPVLPTEPVPEKKPVLKMEPVLPTEPVPEKKQVPKMEPVLPTEPVPEKKPVPKIKRPDKEVLAAKIINEHIVTSKTSLKLINYFEMNLNTETYTPIGLDRISVEANISKGRIREALEHLVSINFIETKLGMGKDNRGTERQINMFKLKI